MTSCLELLDVALARRELLPQGSGVLIAVSGGVDSMVLLHALHALAPQHGWRLVVAHFNHKLRGAASDADARFVARAAQRLGLRCVVEHGEVTTFARAQGWSTEMAARELRHEFLARTARKLGLGLVALAHHADDQVELFFLRLLRGAGSGLAGMKWQSPSPADQAVMLLRPLLNQPKTALLSFAREQKIRFREDASNASVDILRNRVRRELLPLLRRRFQSGLDRIVLRAMDILGAESDFAHDTARAWRRKDRRMAFLRLPVAVQRQCLCQELLRLGFSPDFELVEQLRLRPGVKHSVAEGWLVREREMGAVAFERATKPAPSQNRLTVAIAAGRGRANMAGVEVSWRVARHKSGTAVQRAKARERFDADAVGPNVALRHWHPGDRFQPIGMARAVKLQDLFTNAKVPASERRRRLLAETADGRIFWVEGLRIAEPFKLTATTRKELIWRWRRGS